MEPREQHMLSMFYFSFSFHFFLSQTCPGEDLLVEEDEVEEEAEEEEEDIPQFR